MPIIPLKCPNCGASLNANSEDEILVCKHCWINSVMKDAIVANYITNGVTINSDNATIVNQDKDFVIKDGCLTRYNGEEIDVVIPDNVREIGKKAFEYNRYIRSVRMSDNVIDIDDGAFAGCKALTSVHLSNRLETIGSKAFLLCSGLPSMNLPDTLTYIGDDAFGCCESLKSINIPSGIERITDCCFSDCTSMKNVNLPMGLRTIGERAFAGCGFDEIHLPDTVEKVGENAFPQKIVEKWKRLRVCRHCGGEFKGVFKKVCVRCHTEKDY